MDAPSIATFAVIAGLGGWVAWEVMKARKEAGAPPVQAPSYNIGNVSAPLPPQSASLALPPRGVGIALVPSPGHNLKCGNDYMNFPQPGVAPQRY